MEARERVGDYTAWIEGVVCDSSITASLVERLGKMINPQIPLGSGKLHIEAGVCKAGRKLITLRIKERQN